MRRVAAATGAKVQTTVSKLQPAVLGTCAKFEEVQVCTLKRAYHVSPCSQCIGSIWLMCR